MNKTAVAIVLIFALLIVGLSFGGNRVFDTLNDFVEANKKSEIVFEDPAVPETIIKYISSNNAGVGYFIDDNEKMSTVSFFSDEFINTNDSTAFIIHYDFFDTPQSYLFPVIKFGVLSGGTSFYFNKCFDLTLNMSEWYDSNAGTGGDNFSYVFNGRGGVCEEFKNLTFILVRNDNSGVDLYCYLNDIFIGNYIFSDTVPQSLSGVTVSFDQESSTSHNVVYFNEISLFGVSSDYSGDLLEVIKSGDNITDSSDFNSIINGQ